ncbi:MAG: hypothetical protein HWN68_08375 [Desulfobacterales bacterium]|nr:hypothetical protein [Desulfobacterales bacterium]
MVKVSLATVSEVAHKVHPTLGGLVDRGIGIYALDRKFWNDGMVGLFVGVPITIVLYEWLRGLVWDWYRPVLFVGITFLSFCVQHLFRRIWVFKTETKNEKKEKVK